MEVPDSSCTAGHGALPPLPPEQSQNKRAQRACFCLRVFLAKPKFKLLPSVFEASHANQTVCPTPVIARNIDFTAGQPQGKNEQQTHVRHNGAFYLAVT